MNVICASSRGKDLAEYLPSGTSLDFTSGATLSLLTSQAKDFLPPPYGLSRRYHVYFLCGVPDITRLVKDKSEHYRECVYDEDPEITKDRYASELRKCQQEIKACGALPIFCTIARVNLEKYNHHTLHKHYTSHLKLQDQYSDMQKNLNQAIDSINHIIYTLNKSNGVSTPFLHQDITHRRGKKHKYFITRWELLYDGLHPADPLLPIWANTLSKVISKNEQIEDTEDETDSRPWLPSSKRPRVE